jgi:cycloeucalenol cycloisomerase
MGLSDLDVAIMQVAAAAVAAVVAAVAYYRVPGAPGARLWLSPAPEKRWAELFFLKYSGVWISIMAVIVLTEAWRGFGPWSYLLTGAVVAVPVAAGPALLYPAAALSPGVPWYDTYWAKANAWIAVFSFIGNHFWTHYFYTLLRATYSLSAHRLNFVPLCMHLFTHAYFATYHVATTAAIRRWKTSGAYTSAPGWLRGAGTAALVFTLAYVTAFMEAFTIQGFEHYVIADRAFMYTVGAVVYGIYFVVSFPMFARMDEDALAPGAPVPAPAAAAPAAAAPAPAAAPAASPAAARGASAKKRRGSVAPAEKGKAAAVAAATSAPPLAPAAPWPSSPRWPLSRAVLDALAAGMAVTIGLEAWRLGYTGARGAAPDGLLPFPPSDVSLPPCLAGGNGTAGLPWVQQ